MTQTQRKMCYVIPMGYVGYRSIKHFLEIGDGVYLLLMLPLLWVAFWIGAYAEVILEDLLSRR